MREALAMLVGMMALALAGTAGGESARLPEGFSGAPQEITLF
ncbi:MAG: hypothetical protein AAGA87_02230 [Pseudomonadota bacterium]